jgi:hypothetical protein
MPPSSATLPFWAKSPPWANLPSSAKLPSLANSPLGKVVQTRLLWQVATGVIASIPLALMQALHCPHCGRCLGAVAIIAVVALASSQTPPWKSCGPPFTGVDARLLVVHSSELISLIALASAPAPTAVRPAFAADGARPLVSAFLADLWARSTPSKAGSLLSSETLLALFFCQLSRFQAALFRFWGVTTPASPTPVPASACNAPQRSLRRGRRPPLGL